MRCPMPKMPLNEFTVVILLAGLIMMWAGPHTGATYGH